MNHPPSTLQVKFSQLMQQVESRLPSSARWITRLPAWAWGCTALGVILLAGRLTGMGAAPEAQAQSTLPDTTLLAFDAVAKLGMVLGLFFVGVYAVRRWRKFLPNQRDRKIAVVETTRLSQRQSLHLVRIGEQLLLIGATDHGLSLLTEVEEASDVQPAAQAAHAQTDFYAELAQRQNLPENYFDFSAHVEPEIR